MLTMMYQIGISAFNIVNLQLICLFLYNHYSLKIHNFNISEGMMNGYAFMNLGHAMSELGSKLILNI